MMVKKFKASVDDYHIALSIEKGEEGSTIIIRSGGETICLNIDEAELLLEWLRMALNP